MSLLLPVNISAGRHSTAHPNISYPRWDRRQYSGSLAGEWKRLDKAADNHQINWQWIKGHAGHEVQEIADKAARTIAAAGEVDAEMLDDLVLTIGTAEL